MFRIWGTVMSRNKIIKDMVAVCDDSTLSNDEKLHECISQICYEFDLQRPIWLKKNQREYDEFHRVILNQDNFIESISFDQLVLELIEEK